MPQDTYCYKLGYVIPMLTDEEFEQVARRQVLRRMRVQAS